MKNKLLGGVACLGSLLLVACGGGGSGNSSSSSSSGSMVSGSLSLLAGQMGGAGTVGGIGVFQDRLFLPSGSAIDAVGNLYVADRGSNTLRIVQPSGTISVLAGEAGVAGSADGVQFEGPVAAVLDSNGNLYISDQKASTIREISPSGVVTTMGTVNNPGYLDGSITGAQFNQPTGLAVDSSNNLYVADSGNHVIRKITPAGVVSTYAGQANNPGQANGSLTAAQFNTPTGLVIDSSGDLFVTDGGNCVIREISAGGVVSTYAGIMAGATGSCGSADSTTDSTTGLVVAGKQGSFSASLSGLTIDSSGNLYVADTGNDLIREVTISTGGAITTVAGVAGKAGAVDTGTNQGPATFSQPQGVAVTSSGGIYVADTGNNEIRLVSISGGSVAVETLVGNGTPGYADGSGSAAQLSAPQGVVIGASGAVIVLDTGNFVVRVLGAATGSANTIKFYAGTPQIAGTANTGLFNAPGAVVFDGVGNLFVADTGNASLRKISGSVMTTVVSPSKGISVIGGVAAVTALSAPTTGTTLCSTTGAVLISSTECASTTVFFVGVTVPPPGQVSTQNLYEFSPGSTAPSVLVANTTFSNPQGMVAVVDSSNNPVVYLADAGANVIYQVTSTGTMTTYAGTAGVAGSANSPSPPTFNGPQALAASTDSTGQLVNLYVADALNGTVRMIVNSTKATSTLAGTAGTFGLQDGTAGTGTTFYTPYGLAVDASGNVLVSDVYNDVIRLISPAGTVTTYAGVASNAGFVNDSGAKAQFSVPAGVVSDSSGNVYVADSQNNAIRKITPSGLVSTLVGPSSPVSSGIDDPTGLAIDGSGNLYVASTGNNSVYEVSPGGSTTLLGSGFNAPLGVAVDGSGNVYVADTGNCVIMKIGTSTPFAGTKGTCTSSFSLTSQPLAGVHFNAPRGIAVDGSGNIYVADSSGYIAEISGSSVKSLAGAAESGSFNGTGDAARFAAPTGMALDKSGNLFVADLGNDLIRKVTPAGVVTTVVGQAGNSTQILGSLAGATISFPFGVTVLPSGQLAMSSGNTVVVTQGANF